MSKGATLARQFSLALRPRPLPELLAAGRTLQVGMPTPAQSPIEQPCPPLPPTNPTPPQPDPSPPEAYPAPPRAYAWEQVDPNPNPTPNPNPYPNPNPNPNPHQVDLPACPELSWMIDLVLCNDYIPIGWEQAAI